MGDFLKIFLVLCGIVAAFFVGKGYGEQTFFASEDFKNIAKTKEELNYTRSELENAKVKLQNIINSADRQKTDELLAQILQVFLADLGIRIQNREAILDQAKGSTMALAPVVEKAPAKAPQLMTTLPGLDAHASAENLQQAETPRKQVSERRLGQIKSNEWMLLNSEFDSKLLKRVTLRNVSSFLANANPEINDCDSFIGTFKGTLIGEDGSRQGSISFDLRNEKDSFFGKISWMNSPHPPISIGINGNCGLTSEPLAARFFTLSDTMSLQVYPLANGLELTGNLYEKRPGRFYRLGTFRIKKISF